MNTDQVTSVDALRRNSWTWLHRNLLLPAADRLLGQPMMSHLRFLERAQWWSHEEIGAYRCRALADLIRTSYAEVPFYRDWLDSASVKPDQIRFPTDLSRLPILTKEPLRRAYPYATTRDTGQKTYETSSSGSTGANFYVREDPFTAGLYRACFLLGAQWSGWQIGDRHMQNGITPDRGKLKAIKDWLLRCHYVSAYDLTDEHLDANLEVMEHYRIGHLWGYPSSLYYLARRARVQGWNRPLRSVMTFGDSLFTHYRSEIESAFSTRVYDAYGCGEGMWISAQCGVDNAYHVHALDVIVEYVDEAGLPVADGQPGNILLTRLHPGPMPLIRYRLGDVGVQGGSRLCRCGRRLEVMGSIQGRETDVVTTPSGNRLIVHFFTGILEHFREIRYFQVVQDRRDSIVLFIVPADGFTSQVGYRAVEALRSKGADIHIDVEMVDDIPVPASGKRRFVINRLAQPASETAPAL